MRKSLPSVTLVALVSMLASVAFAGEENSWVTDDGHAIHMHAGARALFVDEEGGDVFNVSDLRDGETRVLGTGAKQVTLFRDGDSVTITREADGDDGKVDVSCNINRDRCKVVTFDDPEKVMIVVEKTRECVNGVGDCDDADLIDLDIVGGAGKHVVIKKVHCDDRDSCEEIEEVIGMPGPGMKRFEFFHGDPDKVSLVCPEGDSRLSVDKIEADDVFLCPKHGTPLEQQERPHLIRRIKVDAS